MTYFLRWAKLEEVIEFCEFCDRMVDDAVGAFDLGNIDRATF